MGDILRLIFESFLRARQRELADDAASLAAVSPTWTSLAADFRRSIEGASENEAKITETVDLETRYKLSLIELQSEHAVTLEEQERQYRRDHHNALQKQKQQSDEERDSALQTQEQQLRIERDNALQKQKQQFETKHVNALQKHKAQLEQFQKGLQEDEDDFESELRKEKEDRDFILHILLHNITKASQNFGFEFPKGSEFIVKVDMAFQLGKLNASRVCRLAFDELSERLNVPLEQWPTAEEISLHEHTDELMPLVTSQVDRIVQACDDRVDTEQCRTADVQRASLISKVMVTEQASNAIGDLRAQLAAKDKLWGQVVTSLEACLAAKDQHIDALTERLRLQTQIIDERHAVLVQMADAAATPVG